MEKKLKKKKKKPTKLGPAETGRGNICAWGGWEGGGSGVPDGINEKLPGSSGSSNAWEGQGGEFGIAGQPFMMSLKKTGISLKKRK